MAVSYVMGSYSMPLYCVPWLIALVGPYYMYCIRTILIAPYIPRSPLVLGNALKCPGFTIGLCSTEILRPWASVSVARE